MHEPHYDLLNGIGVTSMFSFFLGWIDVFLGSPYPPLSEESFLRFCGTRPPPSPIIIPTQRITVIAKLFNKRYYDGSSILWPTELKGFAMTISNGIKLGFREYYRA